MSRNLYVIGNGFDLWHGLPTSYRNFNCFMCRNYPKSHSRIGRMYNQLDPNMLWSDYEKVLGDLEVLRFVEQKIDNWINMDSKSFKNEFDTLHSDITGYFHDWVKDINYSIVNKKRICSICHDKNAWFLTFNYTSTLENFYGIQDEQICYIHGDTGKNPARRPIVGHGISENEIDKRVVALRDQIRRIVSSYMLPEDEKKQEKWTEDIEEETINFLKGIRKKTENCLEEKSEWFKQVKGFNDIYVLGHSLSDIDAPYFERIYKANPDATWRVSCLDESEKVKKAEGLCKMLEISMEKIQIKMFQMDELCCKYIEK